MSFTLMYVTRCLGLATEDAKWDGLQDAVHGGEVRLMSELSDLSKVIHSLVCWWYSQVYWPRLLVH